METTVTIDGRQVRFKCTAAVPLLYRRTFGKDLIRDLNAVAEAMRDREAAGKDLPVEALETFERLAYIMAKHADPDMEANSPEEWLEGFEVLSIYSVFPVIQALWAGNLERLEQAQKKTAQLSALLQPPSSS